MAVKRNPVRFRCIDEMEFERMPVRTHIISEKDDIVEVIDRYTRDVRRPGDVVAVSESVTAISQGRAIPEDEIRIGILASLLWRFVKKVPYGV